MLAISTRIDSGQPVGDQSRTTPCMMVSVSVPAGVVVASTGNRFAGT